MHLSVKMAFAALLLGTSFGMTPLTAHAATPGCPSATQKAEGEIGAGNGTQQAAAQKAEGEIGAGNSTPKTATQKAEGEIGAGAQQQASATPCK